MPVINIKSVPKDLFDKLRRKAEEDHRSMSSEVIVLLENSLNEKRRSILDYHGIAREEWKGVNVEKFIENERKSWGP